MKDEPAFIPALRFGWLTPCFDAFLDWLLPEDAIKGGLVGQAGLAAGQEALDVGCGTGTLALRISQAYPEVTVHGIDVDPRILGIARRKAERAGRPLDLRQASALRLPWPEARFDRVFSTLMLHHLARDEKRLALRDMFRVLKPGGVLLVADFAEPRGAGMWLISWAMRWAEEVHDNVLGLLPGFMEEAGFDPVREIARYRTLFGSMAAWEARKPGGGDAD